jgi:hypothetical protein
MSVLARSPCDKAIQFFFVALDCFARARNDVERSAHKSRAMATQPLRVIVRSPCDDAIQGLHERAGLRRSPSGPAPGPASVRPDDRLRPDPPAPRNDEHQILWTDCGKSLDPAVENSVCSRCIIPRKACAETVGKPWKNPVCSGEQPLRSWLKRCEHASPRSPPGPSHDPDHPRDLPRQFRHWR